MLQPGDVGRVYGFSSTTLPIAPKGDRGAVHASRLASHLRRTFQRTTNGRHEFIVFLPGSGLSHVNGR
jgi:hypothetical protein